MLVPLNPRSLNCIKVWEVLIWWIYFSILEGSIFNSNIGLSPLYIVSRDQDSKKNVDFSWSWFLVCRPWSRKVLIHFFLTALGHAVNIPIIRSLACCKVQQMFAMQRDRLLNFKFYFIILKAFYFDICDVISWSWFSICEANATSNNASCVLGFIKKWKCRWRVHLNLFHPWLFNMHAGGLNP